MDQDGPGRAEKRRPRRSEIDGLRAELKARIAEADWLKAHYDEQLRTAFAQIESLHSRLRILTASAPGSAEAGQEHSSEVKRLRAEMERLSVAEQRYLDRIEELKEAIARHGPSRT